MVPLWVVAEKPQTAHLTLFCHKKTAFPVGPQTAVGLLALDVLLFGDLAKVRAAEFALAFYDAMTTFLLAEFDSTLWGESTMLNGSLRPLQRLVARLKNE